MTVDLSAFVIMGAGILFGAAIGVGVALGLELVMRAAGDGRAVILTWARVKTKEEMK